MLDFAKVSTCEAAGFPMRMRLCCDMGGRRFSDEFVVGAWRWLRVRSLFMTNVWDDARVCEGFDM